MSVTTFVKCQRTEVKCLVNHQYRDPFSVVSGLLSVTEKLLLHGVVDALLPHPDQTLGSIHL